MINVKYLFAPDKEQQRALKLDINLLILKKNSSKFRIP